MRNVLKLGILGALSCALVACGSDTPSADAPQSVAETNTDAQQIITTWLKETEAMAIAIENVSDDASANNAVNEIQAAQVRLQNAYDRWPGKVSRHEALRLFQPRQADVTALQMRLSLATMELTQTHPDLAKKITAELQKMPDLAE